MALCVTSQQFIELGYLNQLQTVQDAFPRTITHDCLEFDELRTVLLENTVHIVHVAAFSVREGKTLIFSPVELPLGKTNSDAMSIW